MCMCCYKVRGHKCVGVGGWEDRDSLEGVESVGVCVWVGGSDVFRGC